jgi:adenylate cyclase class IV
LKLEALGAKLVKKVIISDTYYDIDSSCILTVNDFWLRCRECDKIKTWQLKYPLENGSRKNCLKLYYEIEDEGKICETINSLFLKYDFISLDDLIKKLELVNFASIGTERLVYL